MLVLQNWVMHILLIQGQQAAPALEIEENLNLSSNIFLSLNVLWMPGMLWDEFPYDSQASPNIESKFPCRISAQVLEDESCWTCVAETVDSEKSSCLPLGCNSSQLLASKHEERSWLKKPLRRSDFDRAGSEVGDLSLEDLTVIH